MASENPNDKKSNKTSARVPARQSGQESSTPNSEAVQNDTPDGAKAAAVKTRTANKPRKQVTARGDIANDSTQASASGQGSRPMRLPARTIDKQKPSTSGNNATNNNVTSNGSSMQLQAQLRRLEQQQHELLNAMYYGDTYMNNNNDFLGEYDFEPEFDYESDVDDQQDMDQMLELEQFQKDDQAKLARPRPEGAKTAVSVAVDDENSDEEIGFAARFAAVSDRGNPIDQNISISLKYLMQTKITDTVLTETMDRYGRPANCKVLFTPKVNAQIWDNVTPKTRSIDLKMQKVQKSLIKGITALCAGLDNISAQQQDTLALLANANFELNMLRRELIKPELNPKFNHLCKPTVKVTENLFGDNLPQQMKDIQEEQKATSMTRQGSNRFAAPQAYRGRRMSRRYNYSPYPMFGRSSQQSHGSFLGQRRHRMGRNMNMMRPHQRRRNTNQATSQVKPPEQRQQ